MKWGCGTRLNLSPSLAAELLLDRKRAFDEFRAQENRDQTFEDNKELLKQRCALPTE